MLIYLQPKFDLNTRRIMGAEALIRWQHSSLSLLSPADFLPAISGTPVMEELDSWILNESIELLADWQQRGCLPTEFHIAINQTADDINTSTWADHLQALLARVYLPPARLEIELVESVLAENDSTIQNNLRQLRELGVSLAIDDFGTGYSNLAYLTRMPFTLLKIDMRFVKNMQESASDLEVVKTIITLAKALDVRTLAEGVETEEQAKLLQELGCDWAQGYLVSPPIPVEEFEKYFLG
jgi:EAL domain-containing protein (putative c-di-GMP-specific phosphodiesterase class I)